MQETDVMKGLEIGVILLNFFFGAETVTCMARNTYLSCLGASLMKTVH